MASTSSNHQQPRSSSAELSGNQASHANPVDSNAHSAPEGYAPNDNQLAGLVEAATAAAGQDVSEWAAAAAVAAAAGQQHQLEGYGSDIHIENDGFGDAGFGAGMGAGRQQLRGAGTGSSGEHGQPSSGLSRMVSKKRKRGEAPLDPALTASSAGVDLGSSQQNHHQQLHQHQHYEGDSLDVRSVPPQSLSEARAVGVHSAAALFRQPSSNKKYTRPPMSKMFSSLELSPENFLHLQAAAKAYMLDDRHPERRECVGQRGKGDTEMVKLRLWNCVRHFLEAEGHGERFFGEHVVNEGMGPRAHIWPRDQQKIISLVIPLLRRMVTNERQRQYANETRKGGGVEERRRRKTDENLQAANNDSSLPPEEQLQMQTQHHMPEQFAPQPQMEQVQQPVDLGLTDLILAGYPTDWNAISNSYDLYNCNYELDNLWSISGLQQPDWRGLVAAVDSHYQIDHNGDYQCSVQCEDDNISRIVNSESASGLRWRVGGRVERSVKNEFGSSIARDVSRIIRENLAGRQGVHPAHDQAASHTPPFHQQQQQFGPLPGSSNPVNATTTASTHQVPISLRLNILQNGKRILPRLDLPAGQCPDLESMKQLICRRFRGQIPGLHSEPGVDPSAGPWRSPAGLKFKVWLPDGLTPVQNDGEWTIALLSAGTVDWMDGDLRVLVDLEGSSS